MQTSTNGICYNSYNTAAICSSGFAAVDPCWVKQMKGQTDTVWFHRSFSTYYAGSANTDELSIPQGMSCAMEARY